MQKIIPFIRKRLTDFVALDFLSGIHKHIVVIHSRGKNVMKDFKCIFLWQREVILFFFCFLPDIGSSLQSLRLFVPIPVVRIFVPRLCWQMPAGVVHVVSTNPLTWENCCCCCCSSSLYLWNLTASLVGKMGCDKFHPLSWTSYIFKWTAEAVQLVKS